MKEPFRIHGMMVVKNEGDIIGYVMKEALRWCDFIYIIDDGDSDDDTFDILRAMARENPRIVLYECGVDPFRDSIRRKLYRHFEDRARPGDWWCRLDADEVYIDDPKEFLAGVHPRHHVVWSIHLQFYLTPEDVHGPADGVPKITGPEMLPRHYRADSSELRFFRHRPGLVWREDDYWPTHLGLVSPRRIRIKHYKYRSPGQIQLRLDTRRRTLERGGQVASHDLAVSWEDKIARNAPDLLLDDGNYAGLDLSGLPPRREGVPSRLVKYLMHGSGLWP